jgi:hypothetical protein
MEHASGAKATVSDLGSHVRVSVPAPADRDAYRAVLDVLSSLTLWGGSDATGEVCLWGSVPKGVEPGAETDVRGEAASDA